MSCSERPLGVDAFGTGAAALGPQHSRLLTAAVTCAALPPSRAAALTSLRLIGALDSATGALTSLGQHLTRMPCDPRIGEGCAGAAALAAAAMWAELYKH